MMELLQFAFADGLHFIGVLILIAMPLWFLDNMVSNLARAIIARKQ